MFVSCVRGEGGGGRGSEVRQCYVFILSSFFSSFFLQKIRCAKEEINFDTYIYSCEQE